MYNQNRAAAVKQVVDVMTSPFKTQYNIFPFSSPSKTAIIHPSTTQGNPPPPPPRSSLPPDPLLHVELSVLWRVMQVGVEVLVLSSSVAGAVEQCVPRRPDVFFCRPQGTPHDYACTRFHTHILTLVYILYVTTLVSV